MKRSIIIVWLIIFLSPVFAQESQNVFGFEQSKFKPLVQVFTNTRYDLNNNAYSFGFTRTHFGFQYQHSPNWKSKIILDSGRPTTVGSVMVTDSAGYQYVGSFNVNTGAHYTVFLKFASLEWKVNKNLTLEGGAILQNHFITQERFWGFRYVAQTFKDLYWHLPSSDIGFIARYKFSDVLVMDAAITNGEGPRMNQDAEGKVKYAGGLTITPSASFVGRVYYHNKAAIENAGTTEHLFSAFAGWNVTEKSRLGAEFNMMENLQNIDALQSSGFSVFGAFQLKENIELFGRLDRLFFDKPDAEVFVGFENQSAVIGGVSITPAKGIHCSFNYQGFMPDGESLQHGVHLNMEFKI